MRKFAPTKVSRYTVVQMYIQHIVALSFSSTKAAEGSSHHSLHFILTLLILFQQTNQLYAVIHTCSQFLAKIHSKSTN